MKAAFLDSRERQIAIRRLQENSTGIQSREFKRSHVLDALKDPQVYLITFVFFTVAFANASFGRSVHTNFCKELADLVQFWCHSSNQLWF